MLLTLVDLTTVLVAVVTFFVTYILLNRFRTNPRLPPQPGLALPVIGHLYKLDADPRDQFKRWRQQYGDVFSFYLGGHLAIVLNGYAAIKEALLKKGDQFSDRGAQYFDVATGTPGRGIVTSNGEDWKEQRAALLSILRHLGMGKNVMAERITEEAVHIADRLESLDGQAHHIHKLLNIAVSNVMCGVLVGKRFEYDDEVFRGLMQNIENMIAHINGTNILNVFPALRHFPGDPFQGGETEKNIRAIMQLFAENYCKKIAMDIDENEVTEPDSIIGAYIHEMNKRKKSGVATFLDDESLVRVVFDLFVGGTETTSTTIAWCLLFMLHHPDAQKNIFEEIEREVGTDRLPTVQDRNKLVYLNAVIMETQRLGDIAPFSIPHSNPKDSKLFDFDIPKRSYIVPNLGSVLSDPKIWGQDVQSFRPERFIDSMGHLIHREELLPFSMGKRSCLGESLASMVLFLFLAILFQRFQFLPADEDNLPSTKSVFGITVKPELYQVRVIRR